MAATANPVRARFAWLGQIATDRALPPLATRVAVVLCQFLNSAGVAWPSVPRVATALGATDRAVQKTIAALVDAGHLTIERNGGRGRTNVLTIVVKADGDAEKGELPDTFSGPERVNAWPEKGERDDRKGWPPVHPNKERNHRAPSGLSMEPIARLDARAPDGAALGGLDRPTTDHSEIESALAAGEITAAEAAFLRRNRRSA